MTTAGRDAWALDRGPDRDKIVAPPARDRSTDRSTDREIQGPERPRPPGQEPPVDAAAARRGLLIIVGTVVIGAIVFWQGLNSSPPRAESPPTMVTVDTTAAPPTTVVDNRLVAPGPSLATPAPTTIAPRDLKILVANAVEPARSIAKGIGRRLTDAGYQAPESANYQTLRDETIVYAPAELRAEALTLAGRLGLPDSVVAEMPDNPPVVLRDAQILVVVGREPASLIADIP